MILAIDYGSKRIGLALGQIIPHGAGFLDATMLEEELIAKIAGVCLKNEVEKIVIGLPLRSGGEDSDSTSKVRTFSEKLSQKITLPIYFENEQFTSAEAERLLGRVAKKDRDKGKVDETAAILILEQFLAETEEIKPVFNDK